MAKKTRTRRQGIICRLPPLKSPLAWPRRSKYKTRELINKTIRTPHRFFLFIADLPNSRPSLVLLLVEVPPDFSQVVFRILLAGLAGKLLLAGQDFRMGSREAELFVHFSRVLAGQVVTVNDRPVEVQVSEQDRGPAAEGFREHDIGRVRQKDGKRKRSAMFK
mgnify:CR=1 FL=1